MIRAETVAVAVIILIAVAIVFRRVWHVWRSATRGGQEEHAGCGSCNHCSQGNSAPKVAVVTLGKRTEPK